MTFASLDDDDLPVEGDGRRAWAPAVPTPADVLGATFAADATWYFVGAAIHRQGWKIYISATVETYRQIVPPAIKLLYGLSIPFKYLRTLDLVYRMNAGLLGYSQIGKCIVAYVDADRIDELVDGLSSVLVGDLKRGPFVPRLPSVWPGANVYYRYGSYVSRYIEFPSGEMADDRDHPFNSHVVGIADPFRRFGGGENLTARDASLARFPIIGEFCRSGKGGVFVGLDLNQTVPTEVVIKLGLRNGQVAGDGRDAYELTSREASVYDAFRARDLDDFIPEKVDTIEDEAAFCLVTQYVDAENMATSRAAGEMTIDMMMDALKVVRTVNASGVVIVDAKLGNFLHDASRCWLVDLESAFLRGERGPMGLPGASTFEVDGLSLDDPRFDEIHFLISCLYRPSDDHAGSGFKSRRIRVREFIASRSDGDAVETAAAGLLKAVLGEKP